MSALGLRVYKHTLKIENGSILLAPQMRHILASLDSVASAADGIQKESCLRGDSNPDFSQQSGSTRLSGSFNTPAVTNVLNPSTKQAHCSENITPPWFRGGVITSKKSDVPWASWLVLALLVACFASLGLACCNRILSPHRSNSQSLPSLGLCASLSHVASFTAQCAFFGLQLPKKKKKSLRVSHFKMPWNA